MNYVKLKISSKSIQVRRLIYLLLHNLVTGGGTFPDSWKLGTSCNDGKGVRAVASKYDCSSGVGLSLSVYKYIHTHTHIYTLCNHTWYLFVYSRRSEKYFRRGSRLDWPEGATSRESMRAVWKLPRLQVLLLYCANQFLFFMRRILFNFHYYHHLIGLFHFLSDPLGMFHCFDFIRYFHFVYMPEPYHATCGPLSWRSDWSFARASALWSCGTT